MPRTDLAVGVKGVAVKAGFPRATRTTETIRPEVESPISALWALGVRRLLLLTGDRLEVASDVARRLGVDFEAQVLPEQKIRVVERLQREGRIVAVVGDGINGSAALA